MAHELERVHAGRGEGQEQEVGLVLVDRAEAVLAIGKGDDAVPRILQDPRQIVSNDRVILDDCHAEGHSSPPGSVRQRWLPLRSRSATSGTGRQHSTGRKPHASLAPVDEPPCPRRASTTPMSGRAPRVCTGARAWADSQVDGGSDAVSTWWVTLAPRG
jgi:hypothetical protein